eukprot:Colp12_sorted_trinity150504_noHs@4444
MLKEHLSLRGKQMKEQQDRMKNCKTNEEFSAATDENRREAAQLDQKLSLELRKFDARVIRDLDQIVSEQQVALQSAGVPYFFLTNKSDEIQLQLYVMALTLALQKEVAAWV